MNSDMNVNKMFEHILIYKRI